MYESLGFTKNPFFTEPLEPSKEGFEKFIGRRADVHAYLAQIAGREGCVHLVTGNPGVGKTTFVNVMQYVTSFDNPKARFSDIAYAPTLLIPNAKKLQINSDETAQSLMLKITSSIIYSLVHIYEEKGQTPPPAVEKQHKWINELIVSVGKPTGGAQALGFGASGGGSSIGQAPPASASISHLSQIDRLILETVLPDLGMNGIYVIVNNLDIVDQNNLVQILNELRDELFSIKSLWIVLLGMKGTYSAIRQHPNGSRLVDNFRGTETALESLSESEAVEILKIRARKLSQDDKKPNRLPVGDSVIREIYKHCDGEIRFLFNVCDQIVRTVLTKYPSLEFVEDTMAFDALAPVVKNLVSVDELGKKQKRLLLTLLDEPLRPKDYKKVSFSSAPDFANVVKDLLRRHLVRKREEGSAVYYEPAGPVVLARHCKLI